MLGQEEEDKEDSDVVIIDEAKAEGEEDKEKEDSSEEKKEEEKKEEKAEEAEPLPPLKPGSEDYIRIKVEIMKDFFKRGTYEDSLKVCEELLKIEPENAVLLNFKGRILRAQRQIKLLRKYIDNDKVINQVIDAGITPKDPEKVKRPESKDIIELVSGMNRAQRERVKKQLNQKISLNVVDAPLNYILNLLFRGTGINIIADQSVLQGKVLTIQVENIPLEGVLRYISRLQSISYSISHETVWITTSDQPMLETRIIRLRSGLTAVEEELDLLEGASTGSGGAAGGGGSSVESDLEKLLNEIAKIIEWPQGSEWVLDKKTNTVFVRSTSDALDKFEKVVRAIDISPHQVLIEAKFIEISDGDLTDVGIEWQFANNARIKGMGPEGVELKTGTGTNFGFVNRPPGKVDFTNTSTGMDLFLTGVLSAPEFDAILHAINTKDSSHTLSSPTLLTMNNFLGTIKVTTDLIYIENYTVNRSNLQQRNQLNVNNATGNYTVGDDDGDGVANEDPPDGVDNDGDGNMDEDGLPWDYLNFGYLSVGSEPVIMPQFATEFEGVILKVLPSIGLDGKVITLTLQPEVTEMVGEQTFNLIIPNYDGTAEIKRPIMNRRTFATKLSIEDGSTVVLGGLKRERDMTSVSRVPVLGNIPILGRLFSRTYTETVSTNLLIFVTAHILEPSGSMYKKNKPEKVITFTTPDGKPLTADELKNALLKKNRR
jgi:type II secretory pathway component GspD/PulD (secretin)